MPTLDTASVVAAVEELIAFLTAFNEPSRAAALRDLVIQIQHLGLTRDLRARLLAEKDKLFGDVRQMIFDGRTLPHMDQEQSERELNRLTGAIYLILEPLSDPFPETDISGFSGSQHVRHKGVYCIGDPAALRSIVERAIEFVRRYCDAVGRGDIKAAYGMSDTGLLKAMTLERFAQEHQKAAGQFGGWALEFQIERFAFVLTDSAARQKSNTTKEGWPKQVSKDRRRCRLVGFWVRNRATKSGSRGSLWLSEEDGRYRLSNFDFYGD